MRLANLEDGIIVNIVLTYYNNTYKTFKGKKIKNDGESIVFEMIGDAILSPTLLKGAMTLCVYGFSTKHHCSYVFKNPKIVFGDNQYIFKEIKDGEKYVLAKKLRHYRTLHGYFNDAINEHIEKNTPLIIDNLSSQDCLLWTDKVLNVGDFVSFYIEEHDFKSLLCGYVRRSETRKNAKDYKYGYGIEFNETNVFLENYLVQVSTKTSTHYNFNFGN